MLVHSAVQRLGPVAAAVQRLGQLVDLVPGAAEDDRGGRRLQVEHPAEGGGLVPARHDVGGLPDQQHVGLAPTPCGRARPGPGRAGGGGPCRRSAAAWSPRTARSAGSSGVSPRIVLDVLGEAHVEHLVGLVEHDHLEAAQVQRAPVDVVERAAGRRHHDVDAAPERAELPADRLAAVDREHPRAHVAPVAVHRLGDLHRELARGHQDQRERLRLSAVRRGSAGGRAARRRPSCPCRSPPARPGHGPSSSGGMAARWIGVGSS